MRKSVGPKVAFPISPAVVAGEMCYATGVPVNLETGDFVGGAIEAQSRQVFANLDALMQEAGGALADIVQITIFLTDAKDAPGMNKVYGEMFTAEPYPSRATIIARELVGPAGMRITATAQAHLRRSRD